MGVGVFLLFTSNLELVLAVLSVLGGVELLLLNFLLLLLWVSSFFSSFLSILSSLLNVSFSLLLALFELGFANLFSSDLIEESLRGFLGLLLNGGLILFLCV